MLWCCDAPLINALASEAIRNIEVLNRQELSVTAWAFATLSERNRPLLDAIAPAAVARMDDFGALEISNLVWAFARVAERNEQLMHAIAGAALIQFQGVNHVPAAEASATPNGLYSIVWSAWRTTRPLLARSLITQAESVDSASREPLVHGVLVMDNEWGRGGHQGICDFGLVDGNGRVAQAA